MNNFLQTNACGRFNLPTFEEKKAFSHILRNVVNYTTIAPDHAGGVPKTTPYADWAFCCRYVLALTNSLVTRRTRLSAPSFRPTSILSPSRGVLRRRNLLPSCGINT
ncbi:unnamed protein product [Sphacelaria rigidula]